MLFNLKMSEIMRRTNYGLLIYPIYLRFRNLFLRLFCCCIDSRAALPRILGSFRSDTCF